MASMHTLIPSILSELNRVVRSLRMYTARHPQVQGPLQAAYAHLLKLLEERPTVTMGVLGGTLLVQGVPVKDVSTTIRSFQELLSAKQLSSFQIQRGVAFEEFCDLVAILCMKPEEALVDGRISPRLTERFRHVRLNQLRYVSVCDEEGTGERKEVETTITAGALEVAGVLTEAGVRTRGDAQRIIEAMFLNLHQSPDPSEPPGRQLVKFMNSIQGELGKLEPDAAKQTARHYFELLALQGIAGRGVRELRDQLLQTVASLSPEVRRAVVGELGRDSARVDVFGLLRDLDPKLRSTAMVTDILQGKLDAGQVNQLMDVLGPSPAEYVKLYELVSSQLMQSKADSKQVSQALSTLFRALRGQGQEKAIRAQGTVMVIDPEEINQGGYAEQLAWMGYKVFRCPEGQLGWEYLRSHDDIQCLILEVKMPGMTGLEILSRLMDARRTVPAVVVTRHPQFESSFEVASYPRLQFLTKPVNIDDLRAAIETVRVAAAEDEVEERILPNEMRRAREIQEKLIPTEAPQISEFDLAFHYKPAHEVGGDYLDFIPLDANRTGIVVADVSGKNITGAMVMVMVRSVFRMLAPLCKGAKATLAAVNQHVTRDIRRGMFVTAAYAILDHSTHTLQIANAGHMPPLLWTRHSGQSRLVKIPGTALGLLTGPAFEGAVHEERLTLYPWDRLLLYTDGVVEAMNLAEHEFGDAQLIKLVNSSAGRRSQDVVRGLIAALHMHRGPAEQNDDITVVCLTRKLPQ